MGTEMYSTSLLTIADGKVYRSAFGLHGLGAFLEAAEPRLVIRRSIIISSLQYLVVNERNDQDPSFAHRLTPCFAVVKTPSERPFAKTMARNTHHHGPTSATAISMLTSGP